LATYTAAVCPNCCDEEKSREGRDGGVFWYLKTEKTQLEEQPASGRDRSCACPPGRIYLVSLHAFGFRPQGQLCPACMVLWPDGLAHAGNKIGCGQYWPSLTCASPAFHRARHADETYPAGRSLNSPAQHVAHPLVSAETGPNSPGGISNETKTLANPSRCRSSLHPKRLAALLAEEVCTKKRAQSALHVSTRVLTQSGC